MSCFALSLGHASHSAAANENVAAIKVSLKLRALSSRACMRVYPCWCASACVRACKHESVTQLLWRRRRQRRRLKHMFPAIHINKIHLIWRFGSRCGFLSLLAAICRCFRWPSHCRCSFPAPLCPKCSKEERSSCLQTKSVTGRHSLLLPLIY